MSTDLDAINYKNGVKNNWRRRTWNLVRQWTPNPRDAVVLYLPGSTNLDRPVAEERGFRPANMIAVERDKSVAQYIRDTYGQSAIDESLMDVMHAWPTADASPRVSVVIADMVCGFDREAMAIMPAWVSSKAFEKGVLVLNIMRGRESTSWSRFIRDREHVWKAFAKRYDIAPKNRAAMALYYTHYMLSLCAMPAGASPQSIDERIRQFREDRHAPAILQEMNQNRIYEKSAHFLFQQFEWRFISYKSDSGQVFDTIVMRDKGTQPSFFSRHTIEEVLSLSSMREEHRECMLRVNRRIAATLAVRTMRLNGQL